MTGLDRCDVAIAGGGLAGGLIALQLAARRPDLDVRVIEQGESFGGNHIWSWFNSDVDEQDRALLAPMIAAQWPDYEVAFPKLKRTLSTGYNSMTSDLFNAHIRHTLGDKGMTGVAIERVTPTSILLAGGGEIRARQVIDARGSVDTSALVCGWQKFVGLTMRVPGGHGLKRPVIMDATVEQIDGFRFVYCLPFDAETVFVEDTYYSTSPNLDAPGIRGRIADYVKARGWGNVTSNHEEQGVLPVVYGGSFDRFWPNADTTARAGSAAGLYQPLTSYSLPDAVRFARHISERIDTDLAATSRAHAAQHWRRSGYYRLLGKMLFRAARPGEHYRVFERFYGLSQPLIERFYAGRSTWADKIRILSGKPPVPIGAAIRAIMSKDK